MKTRGYYLLLNNNIGTRIDGTVLLAEGRQEGTQQRLPTDSCDGCPAQGRHCH
jgi:hypothetical protein